MSMLMNACKVNKSHKRSISGLEALKSMWGEVRCVHKSSKLREWIHFHQQSAANSEQNYPHIPDHLHSWCCRIC